MYNAGLEDAKTGATSAEGSREVNPAAKTVETGTTEIKSGLSTEKSGATTTKQSTGEVNAELESKLEPFKLSSEERAAAEEYARTGKDSAISNDFARDSVKRIMDAAKIIKEYNGQNGIDSRQGERYNGNGESQKEGEFFYIDDWDGYPSENKPFGPFRIIYGDEYIEARKQANAANLELHKNNSQYDGLQIHEVHPVKFGGSPIDINNKIILTPKEHAKYTTYWNRILKARKGMTNNER
ncbi:MAG TPA: hypothetical protein PK629_00015 [Oscillospiraceae bacterium]|nr:hypothetical protein [Oscillospiraceae bacterium]HPK35488.1 hypothetical protein [Oscillospiraceae bacterium]